MSVYNGDGTILDQYIKKQVDPNGYILVVKGLIYILLDKYPNMYMTVT